MISVYSQCVNLTGWSMSMFYKVPKEMPTLNGNK